jgi:hypothetical protein
MEISSDWKIAGAWIFAGRCVPTVSAAGLGTARAVRHNGIDPSANSEQP